jgi:hypothetical protein
MPFFSPIQMPCLPIRINSFKQQHNRHKKADWAQAQSAFYYPT